MILQRNNSPRLMILLPHSQRSITSWVHVKITKLNIVRERFSRKICVVLIRATEKNADLFFMPMRDLFINSFKNYLSDGEWEEGKNNLLRMVHLGMIQRILSGDLFSLKREQTKQPGWEESTENVRFDAVSCHGSLMRWDAHSLFSWHMKKWLRLGEQ